MRQRIPVLVAFLASVLAGCSRSPGIFSDQNARAHIQVLAGTIGSRPLGTEANARARAYVIDQLKLFGYEVRVQEADARRAEFGYTARVANIIATRPGSRAEAVALVSHYDSRADTPGAGDDGFGVGVSLEAARVLAAQGSRNWTTYILITDGEEAGLMGAAAMMTDRTLTDHVRAYLNLESVGSSGPAVLFETGPGNAWIAGPWARHAPHPRGGSYAIEIYRRMPNDTDFSIFRRQEIPGLNFAIIGDSYAYHTPRDVPDRLSTRAIRETGENVVAIVNALDRIDITQRSGDVATYFDIGGTVALSYGPATWWLVTSGALLLGVLAWLKMTAAAIRMGSAWRWLLTAAWSLLSMAVVVASMVGVTWALRATREVYHPWYARPGRLFFLLLAVGVTVGWSMGRIGQWLPPRAHGMRHPAVTWSLALPLWIALTAGALWYAPAAAYLWTWPLLTAAVVLLLAPGRNDIAIRVASVLVLAVAATLWLRDTVDLLHFVVAIFGRLPIITPVFVYAVMVAAAGLMVAPPFIAAVAAARPLLRPSLVTAILLIVCVTAAGLAYAAPAYTYEQPLRRHARAFQEPGATDATWEVGSREPGLDLEDGAPFGWAFRTDAPAGSIPLGRLNFPFVFRTTGPGLGPSPVQISQFSIAPLEAGHEVTIAVVPRRPSLGVSFVLPAGLTPARSSLPGITRRGRWTATYQAPPAEGIAWRASFANIDPVRLRGIHLAVTDEGFPGGEGWQRLPTWLPQERTVWSTSATWIMLPAAAPLEPVPPLR